MSDPLPLTLIALLIVLALGMLVILVQVRRSARKFEAFLDATQRDFGSITADVRALRLRLEQLSEPLRSSTRELSEFTRALGELGRGLLRAQDRVQAGLQAARCYLSGLGRGLTTLLPFLKR